MTARLTADSLGKKVEVPEPVSDVSKAGSAAYLFWLSKSVNGCETRNRPKASKLFFASKLRSVSLLMNLTISSWFDANRLRYSLSWLFAWLKYWGK